MRTRTLAILLTFALILVANFSSPLIVHGDGPTSTVLAKGSLAKLPDGDLIFRVVDLNLAPTDTAVTHKHGAGMMYAIDGTNELMIDNNMTSLSVGQAVWIDDQVEHTHSTDGTTPIHFLFMYLWPAEKKGAPMAPGFQDTSSVAFESTPLTFANRNGQDVVLSGTVFEAGQTSDWVASAGPTMLNVQGGAFTVEIGNVALTMQTNDYLSVPPDTAVHIVSKMGGHLLSLSVVPSA